MTRYYSLITNVTIKVISIYFIETTLNAVIAADIRCITNFRDSPRITRTQTSCDGIKIGPRFHEESACRIPRACACMKPAVTHKKLAQEA